MTVVKAPSAHRGAKGLIPIDGSDDEHDSKPLDSKMTREATDGDDAGIEHGVSDSPQEKALSPPPMTKTRGSMYELRVGESHGAFTNDLSHEFSIQHDSEYSPQQLSLQVTLVGAVDDKAAKSADDEDAGHDDDVADIKAPTLEDADAAPAILVEEATVTAPAPTSVSPSVSPAVSPGVSPGQGKPLVGIKPPMALGIDGDEPLPPKPVAPIGVAPAATLSNAVNPVFVIPERCTLKTADGKTDFKCPYCGEQNFLSEYVLRSHLRAKHGSDASFLVHATVLEAIIPHLRELLAVDGPVSGGSASVEQAMEFLPEELRAEIRDVTHFEAITTKDDDFVVFEYTTDLLKRHCITDDVAVAGQLRIAQMGVPYSLRDKERSVGFVVAE